MTENPKSAIQNRKSEDSAQPAGAGGQGDSMIQFWIFDFGFSVIERAKSRAAFVTLCALLLVPCVSANAQQPTNKIPRIGLLANSRQESYHAFREGLRDLGYIEGKNVLIEARYADAKPERLAELGADLARLKVDIIMARGGQSVRAAKNATNAIPIVMFAVSDPVALGFVASLARPEGNVTGLSTQAPELGGKRLELLKEIVPKLSRVAVLGDHKSPGYDAQKKEIEIAAPALGLKLQIVEPGPHDLEKAFSAITKERAGALVVLQGPLTGS
jgi:putative ABC transport system substrate-binding protein